MLSDRALPSEAASTWQRTVARGRELLAACPDADRTSDEFSFDRWRALAALGIHGLPVPAEYGGQGADPVTIAAMVDALGYACTDNGLNFTVGAHVWSAVTPMQRFGTEEQKQKYLPGLCDGSLIG